MLSPLTGGLLLLLSSSASAFTFSSAPLCTGRVYVGLERSSLLSLRHAQPRFGATALKGQLGFVEGAAARAQLFLSDAAAAPVSPPPQAPAAAAASAAAPAAAPTAAAPAADAAKDVVVQQGGSIVEQIFGSDSLVLTAMATVVLLLGVSVTAGVVYLTYSNFQEEQYMKRLQDPNSQESRALQAQSRALEAKESGAKGKKSKAMAELEEMESGGGSALPQIIPDEPGNRDARRAKAKRRRAEQKQAMKKAAQDTGPSSFSEEKNKGWFDGLF